MGGELIRLFADPDCGPHRAPRKTYPHGSGAAGRDRFPRSPPIRHFRTEDYTAQTRERAFGIWNGSGRGWLLLARMVAPRIVEDDRTQLDAGNKRSNISDRILFGTRDANNLILQMRTWEHHDVLAPLRDSMETWKKGARFNQSSVSLHAIGNGSLFSSGRWRATKPRSFQR